MIAAGNSQTKVCATLLEMLSQVVELIESKNRFAITSHARPDGDSLGSSLGLYWLLRALDKDELCKRMEALEAVLLSRKDNER